MIGSRVHLTSNERLADNIQELLSDRSLLVVISNLDGERRMMCSLHPKNGVTRQAWDGEFLIKINLMGAETPFLVNPKDGDIKINWEAEAVSFATKKGRVKILVL